MAAAIDALIKELDEVRKQLESYQELKAREERLAAALSILQGNAPVGARSSAPARHRGRRDTIDPNSVIHAIHVLDSRNGSGAVEIREQMGLSQDQANALSVLLKRLVDDGQLERIGERRASRYVAKS